MRSTISSIIIITVLLITGCKQNEQAPITTIADSTQIVPESVQPLKVGRLNN